MPEVPRSSNNPSSFGRFQLERENLERDNLELQKNVKKLKEQVGDMETAAAGKFFVGK